MKIIHRLNLLAITLYFINILVINSYNNTNLLTAFTGIILLFVIIPLSIVNIFRINMVSKWDYYLFFITTYFFIFVPIFRTLNNYLSLKITPTNILICVIFFALMSMIFSFFRKYKKIILNNKNVWWRIEKDERLLIVAIILFVLLHMVNFYFYKFIPEWDGYGNLLDIEKIKESGTLINNYRSFYFTAISIVSTFANINPYTLYESLMIIFQVNILIVLYLAMRDLNVKNMYSRTVIFLAALSIPVINMEIDMVRPQNMIIIFFPIYIYYLIKIVQTNSKIYWTLTTLIAFIGVGYHEFFVFILLIQLLWICIYLSNKYYLNATSRQNKLIFILATLVIVLLVKDFFSKSSIYPTLAHYFKIALINISNFSAWRLWFLNNYNTDGANLQMGWPGILGSLKYYSYYLSPIIIVFLIAFSLTITKFYKNSFRNKLYVFSTIPFLIIFFSIAEILPRINFSLLPDRYWLMFDIALLISIVFVVTIIEKTKGYKLFITISSIAIIVSFIGSFYVAINKKSLTTMSDFQAAEWIKNNTPSNSYFISQMSYNPMINYFARRKLLIIDDKIREQIELSVDYNSSKNSYDPSAVIFQTIQNKQKLEAELTKQVNISNSPIYILFSKNKFTTLYNQRPWWKNVNYYGANIEKFNNFYPLVYDQDGINIWKIK